ncbi:MAG: ABC transporter ATP-binding protein [Phycisphaeraceae bacterium]|nr:ABC transporter ATP-binding protein [Phycisphaeraceae bacterium]
MSSAGFSHKSLESFFAGAQTTNWGLIKWMVRLGLSFPRRCLTLLCIHLVMLGLTLGGLSLVGTAIDLIKYVVGDGPRPTLPLHLPFPEAGLAAPMKALIFLGVGIVLLALVRMGLRYGTAVATSQLINTIMIKLRTAVYDKLQRLSFRFFDANETGSIINRATSDVAGIASFAEWAIIQIIVLLITLVAYFLFMLQMHPTLTLVGLATSPLLMVASIWYSHSVRPALEHKSKLYDRVILTLSENVLGQHVVKGFALEDAEIAKFHAANDAFRVQQRWLFKRSSLYSSTVWLLTQVNLVVVLLYGGFLVIADHGNPSASFTVGSLIVFAALLQQFSSQVEAIANVANTLQASLTSAGRVYEVLHAPLEISSAPDAISISRLRGDVEFDRVSFGYFPSEPVLTDLSFKVQAGQCVAILGATGTGKSTLLSLIPRFYDPTGGRLLIDGIDVRKIKLEDLRRNIGLVFQESFLFSNTIANNIAFGQPNASREQVIKAAQIAAAHDFIMELPKGYDTVIGEQGMTLSGGQRQRLAIARAILLEPAILILDDATAAIDPETEHEILLAMDNAMKGRTTFVVAHRLSTLNRADFVIVLDRGRIVEAGTQDELMKRGGRYMEVAKVQVGDAESRDIMKARLWYEGQIPSLLDDVRAIE